MKRISIGSTDRPLLTFLPIILLSCCIPALVGFIPTRAQNGNKVSWSPGAQLTFRANTNNVNGLNSSDVFQIFTTSLNRWKQAAKNGLNFRYYQGTDTNVYPNTVGISSDNSVFFTSQGRNTTDSLGCGTVALTQVWYNSSSGNAIKADVRFNDNCFQFTTNPVDTGNGNKVYLGDVSTHEFGHALGLDHSQHIHSTMIYTAYIEENRLSCDEQNAMLATYAPASTRAQTGSLTGRILSPRQTPIFGAFVEAISIEGGKILASTLSDTNGSFNFTGLAPGNYSITVSPYNASTTTLSQYYGSINSNVCNGSPFTRSYPAQQGVLTTKNVTAGQSNTFGDITVSCSDATSQGTRGSASFANADSVSFYSPQLSSVILGSFASGSTQYFKVPAVSGNLFVRALSHSLYYAQNLRIDLFTAQGQPLYGQSARLDSFVSYESGFTNFDPEASFQGTASSQDVIIRVSQEGGVSAYSFPTKSLGVSSSPIFVLSIAAGSLGENLYANNIRCAEADGFSPYVSSGSPSSFSSGGGGSGGSKSSGGCGLIQRQGGESEEDFTQASQMRLFNFLAMLSLCLMGRYFLRLQAVRSSYRY